MNCFHMFGLEGKTALITGSTRGLGRVIAEALAGAGAMVVLNGTNAGRVELAVSEFHAAGLHAVGHAFNVLDRNAVREAAARIQVEHGPVDILVNNAGIQVRGPLAEFAEDDWDRVIGTNLTGVFLLSKALAPAMIERKSGKIINVCSVQSELGRPTIAPYAAAKGGVKMLTKAMATEWGRHNIQVNGIGPGYFMTEMNKPLVEDPEFSAWLCARTPAGRWGDPSELAGAAIFLASRASDYVNGHILYVDGGLLSCV